MDVQKPLWILKHFINLQPTKEIAMHPLRILIVCYGNTCRSPMFAQLLSRALGEHSISRLVESAGMLKEAEGQPAATDAIQCLDVIMPGHTLRTHRSRHISSLPDLAEFDRIYCVEGRFVPELLTLGIASQKIQVYEIPNPWERGLEAYYECATTLQPITEEIVKDIIRDFQLN